VQSLILVTAQIFQKDSRLRSVTQSLEARLCKERFDELSNWHCCYRSIAAALLCPIKERNMRYQTTTAKLELLVFLIFAFAFLSQDTTAQNNQISKVDTSSSEKWEYCVVSGFSNGQAKDKKLTGEVVITYFQRSGPREEWIRAEPDAKVTGLTPGDDDRLVKRAIAMALSQLGDDGWELVGIFPYKNLNTNIVPQENDFGFYFKRRKRT
jgi:hypothetical protein